ncbi:hypothetical protein PRIC1_000658 [Phytophthora ramorum]
MPPRNSRLRRFLLLTAAAVAIALSVSVASAEVSVDVNAASKSTARCLSLLPRTSGRSCFLDRACHGDFTFLNLETGKREAKLVDPNEDDTESMRSVVVDPNAMQTTVMVSTDISGDIVTDESEDDALTVVDEEIPEEEVSGAIVDVGTDDTEAPEGAEPAEPNWNHDKIYEVLQALPEPPKVEGMDIHEAHEKLSPAEFRQQIVTLWKKRQAELKEALESLQDDAKYLVQDLDKTHVFNFIGGFGIIAEYLNSTILPIRAHAAWVVGSAAKNYKDGQEWAIDAGVMPKLVDSLTLEVPSSEAEAKDVLEVKKKAIYALSSIVRSNERGQRLFSLHKGPELLAGLFDDAHPAKLQLKVLLFVYDLLAEAAESKSNAVRSRLLWLSWKRCFSLRNGASAFQRPSSKWLLF